MLDILYEYLDLFIVIGVFIGYSLFLIFICYQLFIKALKKQIRDAKSQITELQRKSTMNFDKLSSVINGLTVLGKQSNTDFKKVDSDVKSLSSKLTSLKTEISSLRKKK